MYMVPKRAPSDSCRIAGPPQFSEVGSTNFELQSILLRHRVFCLAQPTTASDLITLDTSAATHPNWYWLAHVEGKLAGCISLRSLGAHHCEIKTLHVLEHARRQGIAIALLEKVLDQARLTGFLAISLETGATAGFAPARRLYQRLGFTECGPFPPYFDHPMSCFMTRTINSISPN